MFTPLTLGQVAEATGGTLAAGDAALALAAVSTDSRAVPAGALFVALKGENFDGHDYLAAAAAAGAAAFVVQRPLTAAEPPLPHVVAPDTLAAYGKVARLSREGFAGSVVGVTGSVGKTTVKEMTATVLEAGFAVHKSAANFNNEIGVPQTVLSLEPSATALVLEMGMRGEGQIAALCAIARPTVGIVTGIGLSHLELLGSRAKIARAKAELLESLPENGTAIFPATDDFADDLRAHARGRILTVAVDAAADVAATGLTRHENGWRATVATPWGATKLFVPSPGRFNVQNALFAVAVGGALGLPLDAIARALLRFTPPPMRLETIAAASGATVLSDCYNAAPDSMVAALQTLAETSVSGGGKRIAILGEMKELGSFSAEAHAMIGRVAAKLKPDMLVLIGTATKNLSAAALAAGYPLDNVHYFDTTPKAAEVIPFIVQSGDVVLVKGSRAMAMEQLVKVLTPEASA